MVGDRILLFLPSFNLPDGAARRESYSTMRDDLFLDATA